jgi:sulfur relay (sulfurtransferase) DsrC/TusE family protein
MIMAKSPEPKKNTVKLIRRMLECLSIILSHCGEFSSEDAEMLLDLQRHTRRLIKRIADKQIALTDKEVESLNRTRKRIFSEHKTSAAIRAILQELKEALEKQAP